MTKIIHDVQKELVRASANGFQLQEMHDSVEMGNMAKPMLLTALMGGTTSTVFNQTSVFEYDLEKYTPVLVGGKSYTERGKDIPKDHAETRYYKIGSKGIRLNVAPSDVAERRKPGTNDFLSVEDILAKQNMKALDAFDFERELEYASLLTTRTNRTAGGPFPTYNFHQDILDAAIPAATEIDFDSVGADPRRDTRKAVEALEIKLASYGLRASAFVVICGGNYMDKAYSAEQLVNFGRELRSTVDLVSMAVPTITADGFRYQNFDSPVSGVTYIQYNGALGGSALVGANDAYLIPVIANESMVKEVYAPAMGSMADVNETASEMYIWSYEDNFEGVTAFYEQNKLSMLPRPDLITKLAIKA